MQAYFSGLTPNIWLLLRNSEKDSKMQKFKSIQESAALLCSKRPCYEKTKKQMQITEAVMSSEMLCHILEK